MKEYLKQLDKIEEQLLDPDWVMVTVFWDVNEEVREKRIAEARETYEKEHGKVEQLIVCWNYAWARSSVQ